MQVSVPWNAANERRKSVRVAFMVVWAVAVGGCDAGPPAADPEPPTAASPQSEGQWASVSDSLLFAFFPTKTGAIAGSPFPSGKAGNGTVTTDTGAYYQPTVCRECSYTHATNLGPNPHSHQVALTSPLSGQAGALDAASVLYAYGQNLWVTGANSSGEPAGLRQLHIDARDPVNAWLNGSVTEADPFGVLDDAYEFIVDFLNTLSDIPIIGIPASEILGDIDDHLIFPPIRTEIWARGFKPIYTRMKHAEWLPPTPFKYRNVSTAAYYHPQPYELAEARFRGARNFCSMREAARAQSQTGRYGMLDDSLASWWEFEIGEYRSNIRLLEPISLMDSDSANLFAIPFEISSQLTPIRGPLLPRMPEVAHSIVWLSGDAELRSFEDYGPVTLGWFPGFGTLIPKMPIQYPGYRKYFTNNQHSDLFMGVQLSGTLQIKDVPVFTLGIFVVSGSGSISVCYGAALPSNRPECQGVDDPLAGGRVQVPYKYAPGWPAKRPWQLDAPGEGAMGTPKLATDAPLLLAGEVDFHLPNSPTVVALNALVPETDGDTVAAAWAAARLPAGMRTRVEEDDDRSISVLDRVQETIELSIDVSLPLGPVTVGVLGKSKLSADMRQITTIREHVSLVQADKTLPSPSPGLANQAGYVVGPQTNMVVTPRNASSIDSDPFTVTVYFSVVISLPFIGDIDIHWEQDLLHFDKLDITSGDTGTAKEAQRLRVGIFSDSGSDWSELLFPNLGVSDARNVYSHLPHVGSTSNPTPFASWPQGGADGLMSCLYEPSEPIPLPPPPDKGGPGAVASLEICYVGIELYARTDNYYFDQVYLPTNICEDQSGFLMTDFFADSVAVRECVESSIAFLCGGTHLVQSWGPAGTVIARVSAMGDPNDSSTAMFGEIQKQCIEAFAEAAYTETQDATYAATYAKGIASKLLTLRACRADAELVGSP